MRLSDIFINIDWIKNQLQFLCNYWKYELEINQQCLNNPDAEGWESNSMPSFAIYLSSYLSTNEYHLRGRINIGYDGKNRLYECTFFLGIKTGLHNE